MNYAQASNSLKRIQQQQRLYTTGIWNAYFSAQGLIGIGQYPYQPDYAISFVPLPFHGDVEEMLDVYYANLGFQEYAEWTKIEGDRDVNWCELCGDRIAENDAFISTHCAYYCSGHTKAQINEFERKTFNRKSNSVEG